MSETTQQTPNIGALAGALAKAQAEFPAIEKDRTVTVPTRGGGSYTFDYATLDAILKAVRPALAKNGLALSQLLTANEIVTLLLHESGATLESRVPIVVAEKRNDRGEVVPPTPQDIGSAQTYMRRYAIQSILCIAAEEDDDGNTASGNGGAVFTPRAPKESGPACPKCGVVGSLLKPREAGDPWYCYPGKPGKPGKGCGARFKFDPSKVPATDGGSAATTAAAAPPTSPPSEQPAAPSPEVPQREPGEDIEEPSDFDLIADKLDRLKTQEEFRAANAAIRDARKAGTLTPTQNDLLKVKYEAAKARIGGR